MKRIYLLVFYFFTLSVFGQESYYYDGSWKKTSDDTEGIPPGSTTSGDSFEVRSGTYTLATGTAEAHDFTLKAGASVVINGRLNVYGQYTQESTSGMQIGSSGILDFQSGNLSPVINSIVTYDDADSKVILTKAPTGASLLFLNPGLSSKGTLEFSKENEIYNVGAITINDNIHYSITNSGITLTGSPEIQKDYELNAVNLTIDGSILIDSGHKLTINESTLNVTGTVTVNEGSVLQITDGKSATISSISLKSSINGQGIIIGTGIACNNVTARVFVNSTITGDGNSTAYREIGIPFNKTVNDVSWGTFDSQIKQSNSQYRHSFDNTTATWANSQPTDNVMGPQQVWLDGGVDVITVTGSLSDMHNVGYSHTMSNVVDINGNSGYNFIFNPSLAYWNIYEFLVDKAGERTSLIKKVAWIMTQNGSNYEYFEIWSELIGGENKDHIGPFQGIWLEYNRSGSLSVDKSYQNDGTLGLGTTVDLAKRAGSESRVLDDHLKISLFNNDNSVKYDNTYLFYSDDASGINLTDGPRDVQNINASKANSSKPRIYMPLNNKKMYMLECLPGEIMSNNFEQGVRLIGGTTENLTLSLENNSLDPSYNVYLIDNQENITTLLNNSDYSFTHSGITGETDFPTTDRFTIKVTSQTLNANEELALNAIKMTNSNETLKFSVDNNFASISNLYLIKINGQIVRNVAANNILEFPISDLPKGVYLAKIVLDNGLEKSFKFIK
jgi:hypothetical protein